MASLHWLAVCAALAVAVPALAQDGGPFASTQFGPAHKLPNGGRPEHKTAFPEIADWSSLKITLQRGGCFGTCPVYQVTLQGNGAVAFVGEGFVAVPGHHHGAIPREAVKTLYQEFAKAQFFWTLDKYIAPVTDLPMFRVSISFDAHAKTVEDYYGIAIGMPVEIAELERKIDAAAGTEKWVNGTDETFAALTAEGWDFKAKDDEHQSLLRAAAVHNLTGLVRQLLAAGVDPKTKFGCQGAAAAAARKPNLELVSLLLDAEAPLSWGDRNDQEWGDWDTPYPCNVLISAASGGNPEVVKAVLARHPDVNRRGAYGNTALMEAIEDQYSDDEAPRDYPTVVRLLVAAGADPNLRTKNGETVLFMASDAEIARILLEAGADPWVTDDRGETALQRCQSSPYCTTAAPVLAAWMKDHPKAPPEKS